ncbi:imidazole glycerol phosphate synthase subunit HisH [Limnohabitans sp. DM1]|uniref:imidazole glycerol phosphate synthase subunit HisH n=1 Tax=Limnohabitans sp. DM1 TaxID=1597955 RepID=UPI000AC9D58F|nr:imidazole glycerol phosphate synthase subunit HisH [Limnohabitans sp. DM1]
MIAIVDYGSGNVAAIADIFKRLKVPHLITRDHAELRSADRYVLPGVGAFDTTMRTLRDSGLVNLLNDEVHEHGKKIMGVCVGMQILGDSSDEGVLPGLGWIPGHIRRIDPATLTSRLKLPHMGWNSIKMTGNPPIFDEVDCEQGFYFLHSYYFDAANPDSVMATVKYGNELPCGVVAGNVFGFQFHPEKSHSNGVAVFRNFSRI